MGFWDPKYWLPTNTTWDDLTSTDTVRFPSTYDLTYIPLYALFILAIRFLFESFVMSTFVHKTGLLRMNSSLSETIREHLTRGFFGKSDFKRTAEAGWNFVYHSAAFCTGLYILLDQPQLHDVSECWRNWPMHPLSNGLYWFYMIQTGRFLCLTFTHLVVDAKRQDFFQMLIHHISTLSLLGMSWTINVVRVGALVLVIHDAADIFIELGKVLRLFSLTWLLKIEFLVLMTVWIGTRLIYYPFWIIRSVIFDAPALLQEDYHWLNVLQNPLVPRVFMIFLCGLLGLHIFWTVILIKIAWNSVKDEVHDVLEERDDEVDPPTTNGNAMNDCNYDGDNKKND